MAPTLKDHVRELLSQIEAEGLYKRERVITSPQSAEIEVGGRQAAQFLRQQLSRPRRQRGAARRGQGGARPLRLRHGLGALHLRHAGGAQAARGQDLGLPRHGGHDPLRLLLRRQWRPVRDAAWRGGRGHLRRAEPCLDHRRRAALQGEALPLRQQRHGDARGKS